METTPVTHTEKLVMCDVKKDTTTSSKRFIELDKFKLWHALTQQNHNLSIENISICLWLEEDGSNYQKRLFSMADDIREVNKISINIYDKNNHFTHTVSRYALMEDTHKVKNLLLSHMEKDLLEEHQYDVNIEPGFCVMQKQSGSPDNLVLGLTVGL